MIMNLIAKEGFLPCDLYMIHNIENVKKHTHTRKLTISRDTEHRKRQEAILIFLYHTVMLTIKVLLHYTARVKKYGGASRSTKNSKCAIGICSNVIHINEW